MINNNDLWNGDIFDERYYNVNKRLLQLLGLWPDQLWTERTIKFFLLMLLGLSGLFAQMRALILGWGKLDKFSAAFAPLMTNVCCLTMLIFFHLHIGEWKKIVDQTRQNWEHAKDSVRQLKILQKHGETGRLFTLMYILASYAIVIGWILTPLWPKVLDIVAPMNQSHKRLEMLPADYMVDPDQFFWLIFFHLGAVIVVILCILLTIDAFYMTIAQHAIAMFEILSYDLENMLEDTESMSNVILNPEYRADVFFHNIVSCIRRHTSVLKYVNDIQTTCQTILLICVGMSAVVLAFTGFQTVAETTPKEDVIRMGLFTIAQTYHLFCITLPGQWISSASSIISTAAYSCRWYMMSMRSRKLILLLIRASVEPVNLTAGKIYVMSIENFCIILKTSMSYLTMLTTFQ